MKDINTYLKYLTKIEHNFNEDLYVGGEEILDSDKIAISYEKPPLFKFAIENSASINYVELAIKTSKLDQHICSCSQMKIEGICNHISAAYLFLRRELLIREETQKTAKKPVRKKARSKQVSEILRHVNGESLLNFVRQYARTDKKFSTALKVHFLSQNQNIKAGDIKHILDSIIPPVSNSKKKISASEWSLFSKTVLNFSDQIKDAITISKFNLAADLLINTIEKLYYIISKFESRENQIIAYLNKYIELTKDFFDAIEAPITKNKFAKKFLSIHTKSYVSSCISFDALHVLLDQDLISKSDRINLANRIALSEAENETTKVHQQSFICRLISYDKNILENHLNQSNKNLSARIMREILQELDYDCISHILDSEAKFLNHILKEEYAITIAEKNNDFDKIFNALSILLEETKNVKYYERLMALEESKISKSKKNSIQEMIKDWPIKERLDILVVEEDYTSLQKALLELNDLELTFKYDDYFQEEHNHLLYELYTQQLKHHLDNHVGIHSSEQTAEILRHIQSTKDRSLYLKVVDFTLGSYGDRNSIKSIIDFS